MSTSESCDANRNTVRCDVAALYQVALTVGVDTSWSVIQKKTWRRDILISILRIISLLFQIQQNYDGKLYYAI